MRPTSTSLLPQPSTFFFPQEQPESKVRLCARSLLYLGPTFLLPCPTCKSRHGGGSSFCLSTLSLALMGSKIHTTITTYHRQPAGTVSWTCLFYFHSLSFSVKIIPHGVFEWCNLFGERGNKTKQKQVNRKRDQARGTGRAGCYHL